MVVWVNVIFRCIFVAYWCLMCLWFFVYVPSSLYDQPVPTWFLKSHGLIVWEFLEIKIHESGWVHNMPLVKDEKTAKFRVTNMPRRRKTWRQYVFVVCHLSRHLRTRRSHQWCSRSSSSSIDISTYRFFSLSDISLSASIISSSTLLWWWPQLDIKIDQIPCLQQYPLSGII